MTGAALASQVVASDAPPRLNLFGFVTGIVGLLFGSVVYAQPAEVRIEPAGERISGCTFHSTVLNRDVRFMVVLPAEAKPGEPVPVIYFLHGRGRDETTLLNDAFTRRALLASRCAIVLPRGFDGWYVDAPAVPEDRFAAYLDEVIATAEKNFPLRRDAAGRAITGWSMGGYGAAYTFLRRANDFAALATIIGIVDYPRPDTQPADQNYPVQPRFGSDAAVWEKLNPRRLLARATPRPLLVAYAERTAERTMNETFLAEARAHGWPVRELRIPGEHVFSTVRELVPPVLSFLELQLVPPPSTPPSLLSP